MRITGIDSWVFLLHDDTDAWKKNADESAYRPVHVPHDWAVEHEFDPSHSSGTGYLPGGVGWYRSHCSISDLGLDTAAAVRLVFHGAYKNAEVWVNGYHVGRRASGWATFGFDLTEIVSYAPDDDLVISVRIDHRDLADSRWYNGSGLTRRVELETHETVSLAPHGTTVTTLVADPATAQVTVAQVLQNHGATQRRAVVGHALVPTGPGGTPVSTDPFDVEVPAGATAEVKAVIDVPGPLLWSAEHPHLYRLTTTITVADEPGDVGHCEQLIGLRSFAFDPDHGFSINGRRTVLKGVCLHEDAGPLGVAVPAEVWARRLLKLKDGGANAIRMAHNPHSPELYDLCDLLGFYVIDEAFDEWENPKNKWWQGHNVYPPQHQGYAADYHEWHARDLAAMIDANKNRPSIIAWSIGNEVDYPNDPYVSGLFEQMTGNNDANKPEAERRYDPQRPDARRLTTLAGELVELVKAHDATRPVTLAAAFPELSSRIGLLDRLDLIGYNYKEHLYAEDHRRFPEQPFVGSENSHSYQAWRHVVDADFVAGQFLWTGIDFLGETPGWPSHGSAAGLLTTAGFAKERWHLRRSWWSGEPMVRLAVRPAHTDSSGHRPFLRDWESGAELDVACFSNAEQIAVRHGDAEVPLRFDEERGFWRGTVVAGDQALTAEAVNGSVTVRDVLVRREQPAALSAEVWQIPQRWAAGLARVRCGAEPVHQIVCRLLDRAGHRARGDVVVHVDVTGGDLLGLDNGDLCDVTAYPRPCRSTLDGRLIIYVRGVDAIVTVSSTGFDDLVIVPSAS